jgi:hypothetical protein
MMKKIKIKIFLKFMKLNKYTHLKKL